RSQLAGDTGGISSRDKQSGQNGTQLADECKRYNRPHLAARAVRIQGPGHLERDNRAAEEAGQNDDDEASNTDDVHLNEDIVVVMRAANNVFESPAGEK